MQKEMSDGEREIWDEMQADAIDDEYDDEWYCTWCGGDGMQENDDPLWYGSDADFISCECCNGTGLRKHQTIF